MLLYFREGMISNKILLAQKVIVLKELVATGCFLVIHIFYIKYSEQSVHYVMYS